MPPVEISLDVKHEGDVVASYEFSSFEAANAALVRLHNSLGGVGTLVYVGVSKRGSPVSLGALNGAVEESAEVQADIQGRSVT